MREKNDKESSQSILEFPFHINVPCFCNRHSVNFQLLHFVRNHTEEREGDIFINKLDVFTTFLVQISLEALFVSVELSNII